MNISTSHECSSKCESGWTTYFDHFSNSSNLNSKNYEVKGGNVNEEEEDEDLSMVSDASSGPPRLRGTCASDPYGHKSPSPQDVTKKSKQKTKTKEMKKHHSVCLDDTASSPMCHDFSQDNAVPPENHHDSVENFSQGESTPKKRLGFLKSSTKGKSGE